MNNSDKKIERITVLAKDFTPAAMEFHKKNMSAKGYRMEGTIVPRRFQIIEGVDDAKDLFEGEEYYACLLYTSPSPRDLSTSRMPSSA